MRRFRASRLLPSVLLQTALRMARRFHKPPIFSLSSHEQVALHEGQTRVGRFAENRVDSQTAQIGIAQHSCAGRVAQLCVCLP